MQHDDQLFIDNLSNTINDTNDMADVLTRLGFEVTLLKTTTYSMLKKNKRKVILATLIILLVAYYFCLPRQLFDVPYSTVVTDRHGQLLGARIADDGQWRFPACDTVPEKFKICLIHFPDFDGLSPSFPPSTLDN